MSNGKCRQWVVSDESQVPAGFKQLKEYGPPRTQGKSGSPEYEMLHRAYRSATIEAYKVMQSPRDKCGPVFVNSSQAQDILKTELYRGQPSHAAAAKCSHDVAISSRQIESAVIALCEINNGITLMHGLLERLANAVENIATQPKTSQQEVTQAFCSNGSHS